jgi:hypothetical protein
MIKSKRIKYLESRVTVLEFQIDLLSEYINSLMDANKIGAPELDAQKWYQNRVDGIE